MKQLKLSIKPKQEPTENQSLNSSGYLVKINDWELGRGVIDFKLEMPADKKPKITITAIPDVIEIDATVIAEIQKLQSEETSNYKGDKQQKDILENLLIYSKELKQNDFHSKIIISADGVYLEQTKEFHPLDETQNEKENSEQGLQDVAKSLPIIESYIGLRQAFTRKGWEEINSLYDYQLNEKERNLSKDLTLDDSETNVFRKHAQMAMGIIE